MLTNVYVDGFNLYYGLLRGTPYKWLDLEALCRRMLPGHEVQRIRYCTAHISVRPDEIDAASRQQAYLRAIDTYPNVSIHLGHFLTKIVRMPLAAPVPGGPKTVEVIKTEEKGSDVNLATYLMADAFRSDAEAFVLISNDSDLMEPLRMVRHELNKVVGLLNPQARQSRALLRCKPTFVKQIRRGVASVSQLPRELHDKHGAIVRPMEW
jgi:NYN domain